MKLFEKFKSLSFRNKIIYQTAFFFILLLVSTLFPYKLYFNHLGYVNKIEYGFESYEFLILLILTLIAFLSFLTLSKKLILIANIFILLSLFYNLIFNSIFSNPFVIYGPIAPETQIGYFFSFSLVVIYVFLTLSWRRKIKDLESYRYITIIAKFIILLIPVYFIAHTIRSYYKPFIISEGSYIIKDKIIRDVTWKYNQYNAFVTKYYSIKIKTYENLKNKKLLNHHLDSVSVHIFNDDSKIKKGYSKKIYNNHFNIEELILE